VFCEVRSCRNFNLGISLVFLVLSNFPSPGQIPYVSYPERRRVSKEESLSEFLGPEDLAKIDLFDRTHLARVIATANTSPASTLTGTNSTRKRVPRSNLHRRLNSLRISTAIDRSFALTTTARNYQ
jgi:hypothetical protein